MPRKENPYALFPQCQPVPGPKPVAGEEVYVQRGYDLEKGLVLKLFPTCALVEFSQFGYLPHSRKIRYEKIAVAQEPIVCVCEYWRGSGGYRIDRTLHVSEMLAAETIVGQNYLCEDQPGVLRSGETKEKILHRQVKRSEFFLKI